MESITSLLVRIILLATALEAEDDVRNVFGHCMFPLGMEEGRIPDDAITASSSYEMKSVGPQNARIRQEKNGGAWCPKAQISSDIREYLEVDLTKDHLITWTETQGRFGNGEGQEYAEAFFLEYWRDLKWHHYKNLKGDKILRGNSNTYLVEKQKLDLPFVASRVRFIPYSQHPRTVCMRVEIYGCVWEPKILSYAIPSGEAHAFGGLNLQDLSYDGQDVNGTLVNGLGQLTDNVLGDTNELFKMSSATNWVGWSNRQRIDLIFEFDEPREFLNCSIHVAHVPGREIMVFAAVKALFSTDGKIYQSSSEKQQVLDFKYTAGVVTMIFTSKIGRFVKLEIYPRPKWLLISEVTFGSVAIASPDVNPETIDAESNNPEDRNETVVSINEPVNPRDSIGTESNDTQYVPKSDSIPDVFPVGNSQAIGIMSGALMVFALLISCSIFLMKQRGRNKVALLQKHTALLCGTTAPGVTLKDTKLPASVVLGGLPQSRLTMAKSNKNLGSLEDSLKTESPVIARKGDTGEYEQNSAYDGAYKMFSNDNLIYESAVHRSERFSTCSGATDFTNDLSYQENKSSESIAPITFAAKRYSHNMGKPSQKNHESYYAATDILTIKRREQRSSSSLFTPLQIQESERLSSTFRFSSIQQISRHRLRILDKLGEGSFGLVYVCDAKGIQNPDAGTIRNRQIVLVRSLWRGGTDSLKKDFIKDMHLLSGIRDCNVARILAIVEEEPMGAVFEYGELGDLAAFMKGEHESQNKEFALSHECLLSFATQIASGMKYLESLDISHCDLAARNCIVNKKLIIKVSDHAMYCNKYDNEYYVNSCYAKIPLRWMSWEAVLMSKTSSQSDVWSYAVTIWEIFSRCTELPYAELTSEQVLENCSKWYQLGSSQTIAPRLLAQPALCPRKVYNMMVKCWNRQAEKRPNFQEIYLFLKRLMFD